MGGLPKPELGGSRRLSVLDKAAVTTEIVVEYLRVRRDLHDSGVEGALAAVPRPAEGNDPADRAVGIRMGRAVDRTLGALPSDSRCLIRALVLARVLARRGVGSRVILGVHAAPDFTAHAWVEHGGLPLLSPGDYERGRLAEL
jgi:hypothetical protein